MNILLTFKQYINVIFYLYIIKTSPWNKQYLNGKVFQGLFHFARFNFIVTAVEKYNKV